MDTTPFNISYQHNGMIENVSIHPCCNDNNIVDYAVWQNGKLSFTITKDNHDISRWKIALKNSDDTFDDELVQNIGAAIHQHQIK
jgi:hypothetical protein